MSGHVALIVCGAPLTERTPDLIRALQGVSKDVVVIATPAARPWLDRDLIRELTGAAPQVEFRDPSQPKARGETEAIVLCPGTFNTINQAATGTAHTYALTRLCSAIGEGLPVIVVPFVNDKLWGHPAFPRSLAVLEDAGVKLVDVHTGKSRVTPVRSGSGPEAVAGFDPAWVVDLLG